MGKTFNPITWENIRRTILDEIGKAIAKAIASVDIVTYKSVNATEVVDIEVDYGTTVKEVFNKLHAAYPNVTIYGTKGEEATVSLNFANDVYDGTTAGVYDFTGFFNLPQFWAGTPDNIPIEVTVIVTYQSVDDTEIVDIQVDYDTSIEEVLNTLHTIYPNVTISGTKGETATVNLTFTGDEYDGTIVGAHDFTGVFNLPQFWAGTPDDILVVVTVNAEVIPES